MNSKSKTNIVTATIITTLVCVCIAAIMTACGVANNGETEVATETTTDSVLYEPEEATLTTPAVADTKNTTTYTSTSESSTNTTTSTDVSTSTTTSEETAGTTSAQATLKTTVKTSAITTSMTTTSPATTPTETSTSDTYLSSTIESTSLYVESSGQAVCTSESTCTTTTATSTTTTTVTTKPQIKVYYTNQDIVDIAKVLYKECRGVPSKTEQACVAWVILNRVDQNGSTVYSTVRARGQFAFSESTPVWDSLYSLSKDVLERWNREKNGETSVGRVLPKEYIYFEGRNGHNYFRDNYRSPYNVWNYSLASPYEN